ncbi:MAG: metallophosphoesterase [Gemmataceae bacterium]
MKVIATSDLHGCLPPIPDCDLLLLAGDLCPATDHSIGYQSEWLDTSFREWLNNSPAKQIVGIAGNHDLIFQRSPQDVPSDLPWTYLEDDSYEWQGFRIYGTPWQEYFGGWAFNMSLEELALKRSEIPDDTDILISHGPPDTYGDAVFINDDHLKNTGCPHLLKRIKQVEPKLVVFGHIHEGRGVWTLGPTTLANVTHLDLSCAPVYPPWCIEL